MALPGIGQYTARAILSFAFGQSALAFDTNQQRVWGRLLLGSKSAKVDLKEIEKHIPPTTPYKKLNESIMDFANLVCTNRSPKCEVCPLRKTCQYFETQGALEEKIVKTTSAFPLSQAKAIVVLHENHQQYFSSNSETYQPFLLPTGVTSRQQIKSYFARLYQLELSVRPPSLKGYLDEQPVMLVNAQILLGTPNFSVFGREDRQVYLDELRASLVTNE